MLITVLSAGLLVSGCGSDNGKKDAGTRPDGGQQPATSAPPAPVTLQFGQPANTTGDTSYGSKDGGQLEVTPTTVIYATGDETHTKPERDGYIIIAIKYRNPGTVAAEPADGTSGAGWQYTGADGEQLANGVALYPNGFGGMTVNPVQPGAFTQSAQTWGIRNNQRGGTIQYTDGAGRIFRWAVPAQDNGPQIAEMKKGLD